MKNCLLTIVALLIASPAFAGPVIWEPADGGNGHAYEIIEADGISWRQARRIAANMTFNGVNGHLATITSDGEDEFVNDLREDVVDPGPGFADKEVWLGGRQRRNAPEPDGGWRWINGEGAIPMPGDSGYENWAPGEPNDYGNGEKFLAQGLNNQFVWNDEGNRAGIYGFVVEFDLDPVLPTSIPEPTTIALFGLGAVGASLFSRRRRS